MFRTIKKEEFRGDSMKTPYFFTNESLVSIVSGLDVCEEDNVFSICGSGDQAFAIAAIASNVLIADSNEYAISYAQERLKFLEQGRGDLFHLFCPSYSENESYFTAERMEAIKENAGGIDFKVENVLAKEFSGEFNKIYLSNIINYYKSKLKPKHFKQWVERAFVGCENGTLVYSTCPISEWVRSGLLREDKILTHIARENNPKKYWEEPTVYQKIS